MHEKLSLLMRWGCFCLLDFAFLALLEKCNSHSEVKRPPSKKPKEKRRYTNPYTHISYSPEVTYLIRLYRL